MLIQVLYFTCFQGIFQSEISLSFALNNHIMQKNKILNLLIAITLLLTTSVSLSSCSKDGDSPGGNNGNYYIKAKFDGKEIIFKHQTNFQGGGNDGRLEHITLGADEKNYKDLGNNEFPIGFSIEIWNEGGNITPGTYTILGGGEVDYEDPKSYTLDAIYMLTGTTRYYANDTKDFTFVISELNKDKNIKGTFKGKIMLNDGSNKIINVTDGELFLPYTDN